MVPNNEASSSVQLIEKGNDPIQDIFLFGDDSLDKLKKKENCSKHDLRKTLLCQTCKKFICDRCLIDDKHVAHQTQNLSKIANDIMQIF
jgi:hypothetical protein